MKMPFKRKATGSADIQIELDRLGQKLADHQRKRSEVLQALAEAKDQRLAILAEDDDVINAAGAKVRGLMIEAEDLAGTITDYETAIRGAEERLRAARLLERQSDAAGQLEAAAAKVDGLVADFEKAATALASAGRKMIAAIPPELGVFPAYHSHRPAGRRENGNDMASAREAVAAVAVEALFKAFPEIFDRTYDDGYFIRLSRLMTPNDGQPSYRGGHTDDVALSAHQAVEAIITGRLRERAGKILAGEIEPTLSDIVIMEPYRRPPPPPSIEVIAVEHFKFLTGEPGFKPQVRNITAGSRESLHHLVATAAIKRGYAALPDTAEAMKALEARVGARRGSGSGYNITVDAHRDLGNPIGLQAAHEAVKASMTNCVEAEEAARALG